MISFRLTDEELVRVDRVVASAIKRNPHLKKANIMREMIGVIDTGIITKEEREYLKDAPIQDPQEALQVPIKNLFTDELKGEKKKSNGRR